LGEQVAPEDLQGWVSQKRQHLSQLQTLVNSLPYEKEKLAGLERDNAKQRKYQGLLNTAGLKSVPDSVEAFFQTVALYKQKVEDAGESVAKAKAEFEELTEHHHILKIALVKLENRHQSWAQLQPQVRSLLDAFPERTDWTQNGCHELQRELYANRTILNEQIAELQAKNIQDNEYLDKL
ncbi:hypothetical protein P7M41_26770, partial [Vibrio parahaemolyticus]|nr:hypothetical protein [Vibrio parahaemolyticus]